MGPPDPEPPPGGPSGSLEEDSVFDEIRRQRDADGGAGGWVLRIVGLAILGLAVWVVARNVSWSDTLRIERAGSTAVLEGEIEGSWRTEEVRFRAKDSAAALEAVEVTGAFMDAELFLESLRGDVELVANRRELRLVGGRAVFHAEGDDAVAPAGSLGVERIDWRPGMVRTLREIDPWQLAPAIGFLLLASLCVATRWWRLLALNGCATSWWNAFRYTYSGLFFNIVVPGINGGDVARAVAIVREHPGSRSDAFMTVVVDRVLGLVGMVCIGTALVLSSDERFDPLKLPVGLFCAVVVIGGALFFNGAVRGLVRFESVLGRLPQGERLLRLDAGARRMLSRPREVLLALALSLGNHVFNGCAVYAAAQALGSSLGFQDWLATMAISNTLAALPLSPGGLGVGEVLFGSLAEMLGSTYAIGVATSLVYRLCLYTMSLLGGLVMLLPGSKPRA